MQTECPGLLRALLADSSHVLVCSRVAHHGAWPCPEAPQPMVCALQIDAASLIAASVMAAPCALAMSKLVYPEVEESKFKDKASIHISRG